MKIVGRQRSRQLASFGDWIMKTYRIELADGCGTFVSVLLLFVFSLTIIGIPFAIMLLPTLYRIVEEPTPPPDESSETPRCPTTKAVGD
jgi:hypothetical protein